MTEPLLSPQTSSYLDVTPSPNKLLADHPLSAFVKTEPQEEEEEEGEGGSCVAGVTVKQEAEAEAQDLPAAPKEEQPAELLTDKVQSEESKT